MNSNVTSVKVPWNVSWLQNSKESAALRESQTEASLFVGLLNLGVQLLDKHWAAWMDVTLEP
jgi:hypothetical protein